MKLGKRKVDYNDVNCLFICNTFGRDWQLLTGKGVRGFFVDMTLLPVSPPNAIRRLRQTTC